MLQSVSSSDQAGTVCLKRVNREKKHKHLPRAQRLRDQTNTRLMHRHRSFLTCVVRCVSLANTKRRPVVLRELARMRLQVQMPPRGPKRRCLPPKTASSMAPFARLKMHRDKNMGQELTSWRRRRYVDAQKTPDDAVGSPGHAVPFVPQVVAQHPIHHRRVGGGLSREEEVKPRHDTTISVDKGNKFLIVSYRHNPKIGENQKWKFSFFCRK